MVANQKHKKFRIPASEFILMFFIYSVISIFAFTALYPFIHILSISLSSPSEAIKPGFHFFPANPMLESYKKILSMPLILSSYGNTMFVVLAGTASSMVFTTLAAYPLSRKKMAFRSTFTLIMVFTMMFSGGIVPTYLLMRSLHLINNRLVLIVSGLVSPYNMIIMKNFFQTIPESLEESAHIDGAGQFKILVNIILPLSAPVLATITLFYAVANWNAFFTCLLYITDRTKMVLQVLLRQLVITSEMNFAENLAAMDESTLNSLPIQDKSTTIIIATLPILLIYPFLQKYFVKGVLIGSVKG